MLAMIQTALNVRSATGLILLFLLRAGRKCARVLDSGFGSARRAAMKIGQRPSRGRGIAYRCRYTASKCQSGSDRLAGGLF
jgi:hypothetical protein